MSDFVILTDSSCDLPAKMAENLGIEIISLSLEIDGKEAGDKILDCVFSRFCVGK